MPVTPYTPTHTLRPVAEDVWIVEGGVIRMAVGPLGVPFTTRMTVIRLGDGSLLLHSPSEPVPELLGAISALGPVAHLVSPNRLHYAFIPAWQQAFPDAIAWASPGVRRRAASQGVAVSFDADLEDAPPGAWAADVDQLIFRGSPLLAEVVFFHRPSRTLVLTDLIQAHELDRLPPLARPLVRLGAAAHPDGQTPLDLQLSFLLGRGRARADLARMLAWNPERVVFAHGRWFHDNGRAQLARAFRWL